MTVTLLVSKLAHVNFSLGKRSRIEFESRAVHSEGGLKNHYRTDKMRCVASILTILRLTERIFRGKPIKCLGSSHGNVLESIEFKE